MPLNIVILAAGKGKRMQSGKTKVLHTLAGKSLIEHILCTALRLNPANIILVCGHEAEAVKMALSAFDIKYVHQTQPLGTAHALQQALPLLAPSDRVLVLLGDTPLISQQTLLSLLQRSPEPGLGIITAHLADPTGYGRIIRDPQNCITHIVEEKEATVSEKRINEINTGIMCATASLFENWIQKIHNCNAQQEYYLTDVVKIAAEQSCPLVSVKLENNIEIQGVNNYQQLSQLERAYQHQRAQQLLQNGLYLLDPARFDLRGELEFGQDVHIDINVILEGKIKIGSRCYIGPNSYLKNCVLGDDVEIKSHSIIENAVIGDHCKVGPFARVRLGTELKKDAVIGNFVEIKNTVLGEKSKANHLTYLGDAKIGSEVNIGAGTITCNYDGVNKHPTIIGDRAFIGSDTQLIAPVQVGADATIGAGSTITENVPANQLTLCRAKEQRSFPNWKRPRNKEE